MSVLCGAAERGKDGANGAVHEEKRQPTLKPLPNTSSCCAAQPTKQSKSAPHPSRRAGTQCLCTWRWGLW